MAAGGDDTEQAEARCQGKGGLFDHLQVSLVKLSVRLFATLLRGAQELFQSVTLVTSFRADWSVHSRPLQGCSPHFAPVDSHVLLLAPIT